MEFCLTLLKHMLHIYSAQLNNNILPKGKIRYSLPPIKFNLAPLFPPPAKNFLPPIIYNLLPGTLADAVTPPADRLLPEHHVPF